MTEGSYFKWNTSGEWSLPKLKFYPIDPLYPPPPAPSSKPSFWRNVADYSRRVLSSSKDIADKAWKKSKPQVINAKNQTMKVVKETK